MISVMNGKKNPFDDIKTKKMKEKDIPKFLKLDYSNEVFRKEADVV